MVYAVQKRDGKLVGFNKNRIRDAVLKAIHAVKYRDEELADLIAGRVAVEFESKQGIAGIEEIQDSVVKKLVNHPTIQKVYSNYRRKRTKIRKLKEKRN